MNPVFVCARVKVGFMGKDEQVACEQLQICSYPLEDVANTCNGQSALLMIMRDYTLNVD